MLNRHPSAPQEMRANIGQSALRDTHAAAMDIARQISQPGIGLIIAFVAGQHDLATLSEYLNATFEGVPVIGCTTVGEFGPGGYRDGDIVAVSIHEDDLTFEVGLLESVSTTTSTRAHELATRLSRRLFHRSTGAVHDDSFALMLIDGASAREELVAHAFQEGLGGGRLVGGTAGTDAPLGHASLLFNGKVVSNAAILLVGRSPFPFEVFKIQHFEPGGEPLVITGAIPARRIVTEINGLPAASEYARAVGLAPDEINADSFIPFPMVTKLGQEVFVRTIRRTNPDGSLTFYCSIEPGMVLRPARAQSMTHSVATAFEDIRLRLGTPTLTLGFDCLLRSTEMYRHHHEAEIVAMMEAMHTVGFSTLGEQFSGMHVNQTLTGIAFGRMEAP